MHGTKILGIAWIAWLIQAAGVAQSEPPCPEAASLPSQALLSGASRERALLRFEGLPVYLVENVGQFHPDVHFFVKGREKSVFFTATGVTVRLCKDEKAHALQFLFEGARTEVRPDGHEQRSTVFSYFRGSDPDEWVRGARAYRAIVYRGLWPGIDLVCDTKGSRLKFTYRVHPGADPARIRIQVRGADGVTVDRQGALHLVTPVGELVDEPPIAHQVSGGRFLPVAVAYELHGGTGPKPTYSFRTGQYDRTLALEVDPAFLVYCGYIGGRLGEMIRGIAVDASGCLYVAGGTGSDQNTFPVKAGPDLTYGGDGDVFVAKVKADGTGLVFCGYLGGNLYEHAESLALDEAGCVYLTGTAGAGFPLKVGPNTHMGWGAFVTKLDATGTEIVYSGLIGGDRGAKGGGIAVDAAGHAYVVGETLSNEKTFPVKVGPDLTFNSVHPDVSDVFVARVDPRGESLDYCGYIGGLDPDTSRAIAVDRRGRAYVAGATFSSPATFPVKVGPSLVFHGFPGLDGVDGFVARINAEGTGLDYCGYIGGANFDLAYDVAVDGEYRAYVVGTTQSAESTFPVKLGPDITHNGCSDVFVCRVKAGGEDFEYCGYLGGSHWESAWGAAVDGTGALFVGGEAGSGLPVKHGPGLAYSYGTDAFVAKVAPSGTSLVYCGYIGGRQNAKGWGGSEIVYAVAVDRHGNAYVAGETTSDENSFPVTVGPDLTYNDWTQSSPPGDAFVAKVALTLLEGGGTTSPGGTVPFTLTASNDPGFPYVVGTSLGTGPIWIDTRELELTFDGVLWAALSGLFPSLFDHYTGTIGDDGSAQAALHLPDLPQVVGVKIHSAFVILDVTAPSGVRSISNTYSFTITRS